MDIVAGKKNEKMSMDYVMKEGKMRINPQIEKAGRGGGALGGMIYDLKAREMIILMDSGGQKMFMRRAIPQPAATPTKTHSGHEMAPPVATGRTETIAGYTATEYKMTTENGGTAELWLGKGLGTFMSMSGNPMAGRGAPPPGWESFVRDGNFFPLRYVIRDAKGVEEARMEVTKVEKTSVPDSEFSTAGYTELSMPGMGDLFKH
ncbi:MAG: hypothetical protein JWM32_2493 [Verrucomicrobia bacterium]|nr:hypothetical protein [Verrucomicrobiota bacterium]